LSITKENRENLKRLIEELTKRYESGEKIAFFSESVHASTHNGEYADQQFHSITIVYENGGDSDE